MTLEEAYALVLREGMMAEPVPDDIVPMILHEGHLPTPEQFSRLVEAIDTVHESVENETMIDRKLAGALWIIGVEANSFGKDRTAAEENALIALLTAVEGALVGFWPVGHPRDNEQKDKTQRDDVECEEQV